MCIPYPSGSIWWARCINVLLQRVLLLGSYGLFLYTQLISVFNYKHLSLWCPYLGQLYQFWHHAALTLYCSVPYFWVMKTFSDHSSIALTLWRSTLRLLTPDVWSLWDLPYVRCIAVLMQRPDLGPLLSWFLATIVMDLLCEECWVARSQKITNWRNLIIAARCNNLCLCSLQSVCSWCAWPLDFWSCASHFFLC